MPIGGNRKSKSMGQSYKADPMYAFAESFKNAADTVLNECNVDIFEEPSKVMRRPSGYETMRRFFVEGSYDDNANAMRADQVEDHISQMNEQFQNNVEAMYEHASQADYNPVIGLAFPIHKNILMNMVYDKGAIQKVTAVQPKFTMSMEKRILVDPDGNEIDMFRDQNLMTDAIDRSNPTVIIPLALPELEATDVLQACGGTKMDSLSIETFICAVKVEGVYIAVGDPDVDANGYLSNEIIATTAGTKDVWFKTNIQFKPGYNRYERTVVQPVSIKYKSDANGTITVLKDTISGTMDANKFNIYTGAGKVKEIRVAAKLDTANAMLDTCTVKWSVDDTVLVEIPNAVPINTTISPEEVKDLAALYQVNQLTKVMSLFKTTLANYKDDKIKRYLDTSYDMLPESQKSYGTFDYAPREGYALDHVEHRYKTFFDFFDTEVQKLLYALNDPNVTISVFGDPDLIRKITPTSYTYQTPASIGPVELDYQRTVVTSDKRVYQFIGSDKKRYDDNLTVVLCPRNSDRIIYRIYDYQMYVSNEIRNINNPALPAVHAFERWIITDYQPVQGRIKILNRSGFRPTP